MFLQQTTTQAINSVATTTTETMSYWDLLMKGGVMIIPILILLVITIYLWIYNYLLIKKRSKLNQELDDHVKEQILKGSIDNALTMSKREHTPHARILRSGVELIGRPVRDIETVMDKQTEIEVAEMEGNLGYLGLIAGIAPILGFIGTISGVITIFYSISTSGDLNIQTISSGLYEKMISSGAGLIVGIIAYSAYHLLNIKVDRFVCQAQKQTLSFIQLILKP